MQAMHRTPWTIPAWLVVAMGLGAWMTPAAAQQENSAPIRLEELGNDAPVEGTLSDSASEDVSGRTDPNTAPPEPTRRPVPEQPGPNTAPPGLASPETRESALPTTRPSPQPAGQRAETFAQLLRRRPPVPVTPPKGLPPTGNDTATPAGPSRPVEGQAVLGRQGTISKGLASAWYVITFRNNRRLPYEAPRRLLPNRLLEQVEEVLKRDPDAVFKVSGETTTDNEHAYLMLRRVALVEKARLDQADPSDPGSAATSGGEEKPDAPDGDSAATTEDILSGMLRDKPGRALAVAPSPKRTPKENVESVAPARKTPFNPGRKDIVIDRVARVVKSDRGPWWEARFESDNTLREPPLRILPNRLLEKAKQMSRVLGFSDLQLRISGEVTWYTGRRYLLLRKLIRQRDMGQF